MMNAPEFLANSGRSSMQGMLDLANTFLAGMDRLTALHLNTARAVMEDSVANTKAVMGAKGVQDLMGLQATLLQPTVEKTMGYSRSVYDITVQTQEELSKVLARQITETNRNLTSALDQAAQSTPGSEAAVAAVKSAMDSMNSVYSGISRASKQLADMAEANIAYATKAVGAATSRTRKVA